MVNPAADNRKIGSKETEFEVGRMMMGEVLGNRFPSLRPRLTLRALRASGGVGPSPLKHLKKRSGRRRGVTEGRRSNGPETDNGPGTDNRPGLQPWVNGQRSRQSPQGRQRRSCLAGFRPWRDLGRCMTATPALQRWAMISRKRRHLFLKISRVALLRCGRGAVSPRLVVEGTSPPAQKRRHSAATTLKKGSGF